MDLEQNNTCMETNWDPNQLFELMMDQIEEGVDYDGAGDNLYTPYQIMKTAYDLDLKTSLFAYEWKNPNEYQ